MGNDDRPPRGYAGARQRAEALVNDPAATERLLEKAGIKADKRDRGRLKQLLSELRTLLRLLRAYVRKEYRGVPWKVVLTALAAVIYFVNPIDLIPDFVPFFGFFDDAAVVGWVIKTIAGELTRFREWEEGRG